MKREILFRGKRVDNGEWIYGRGLQQCKDELGNEIVAIFEDVVKSEKYIKKEGRYILYYVPVNPETFGQYTGMKDKNGKNIFEEDIVRFSYITDGIEPIEIECLAKVVFEDGSFMIKCVKGHVHNSMQRALFTMDYFNIKVEVVGNITDNPELMK